MTRTHTQMAQEVVEKYSESGQPWPATSRQMAEWAIQNKLWVPHPARLVNMCADQLARAMSEQYITDPQGRRVRAKHVVRIKPGDKQLALWDDMRTAGHAHMEVAFQQSQPTGELAEQRRRYNPDGYLFITRKVLPRLRELGASQEDIRRIMVDNPRRFFAGNACGS